MQHGITTQPPTIVITLHMQHGITTHLGGETLVRCIYYMIPGFELT
jgi:hypothetical protein